MTLLSMYSEKWPTVQALTRFSHRSSEGKAKGLRAISCEVFRADDQIQTKGTRKMARNARRTMYMLVLVKNLPRLRPPVVARVGARDSLVTEETAMVRPPDARADG